jgi:hypothetical protein
MLVTDAALDAEIRSLWTQWLAARAEEHASWAADGRRAAGAKREKTRKRVESLSRRIIESNPASIAGIVIQLRILATIVCQTPPDRLISADLEERWLRTILVRAEDLATGLVPSWSVDEDANGGMAARDDLIAGDENG